MPNVINARPAVNNEAGRVIELGGRWIGTLPPANGTEDKVVRKLVDNLHGALDGVVAFWEDADRTVASIDKDRRLSDLGKREATEEELKAVVREWSWLRDRLDYFESKIESHAARLAEAGPAKDPDHGEETRRMLRNMDGTERAKFVLQAVANGDRDVIDAIMSAPPYLSGVKGDLREQVESKVVEIHGDPRDREALDVLTPGVKVLRKALGAAGRHVLELGGARIPDDGAEGE